MTEKAGNGGLAKTMSFSGAAPHDGDIDDDIDGTADGYIKWRRRRIQLLLPEARTAFLFPDMHSDMPFSKTLLCERLKRFRTV